MIQHVTEYDFRDTFRNLRPNNFSHEGLGVLFEYLEQLEDDIGEPIEFDCIAICCEYTEYENLEEFNREMDESCESVEDIHDLTTCIPIPGTHRFIVADF